MSSDPQSTAIHEQRIARLRDAVDWLEAHPESSARLDEQPDGTVELTDTSPSSPEMIAAVTRALGGGWAKKETGVNGQLLEVSREVVPGVTYRMIAWREEVCTRVVIGTKEREVVEPDPEQVAALPTVKRTEVEEIVEWRCEPLLADREAVA